MSEFLQFSDTIYLLVVVVVVLSSTLVLEEEEEVNTSKHGGARNRAGESFEGGDARCALRQEEERRGVKSLPCCIIIDKGEEDKGCIRRTSEFSRETQQLDCQRLNE